MKLIKSMFSVDDMISRCKKSDKRAEEIMAIRTSIIRRRRIVFLRKWMMNI